MAARNFLKIFTVLLLTGITSQVSGQSAYVNTQYGIYQLTGGPGSCERTLITNPCGQDNSILSMAVYKDTVYYNTWGGELRRFKIGVPGSCETLIDGGPSYNAMTVDKDGMIYMAQEDLAKYNPYTKELTIIGRMPYLSAGDILFYKDKLLLAGYNPYDWGTGIFEIDLADLSASKPYMETQDFFGLMAYPVPCGENRYFGLYSSTFGSTQLIELDLENKTVKGEACEMPLNILDAASITETGIDSRVSITSFEINKTCQSLTGSVQINAFYPGTGNITYTLDNSISNSTGSFSNIVAGQHSIKAIAPGGVCSHDTAFTIIPAYNLVKGIAVTNADACLNTPGNVSINASSAFGNITYTLVNSGLTQGSGDFAGLRGGQYMFRIEDASGCRKDTSVAIMEKTPASGCNNVFIPNAFTPNNDGRNDLFMVSLSTAFKDVTLQIFNRWGTIVCQAKGNNPYWDGIYKGVQQPSGVYVCTLTYTDYSTGEKKITKGTLTLIR